jgi:hypothetical protein
VGQRDARAGPGAAPRRATRSAAGTGRARPAAGLPTIRGRSPRGPSSRWPRGPPWPAARPAAAPPRFVPPGSPCRAIAPVWVGWGIGRRCRGGAHVSDRGDAESCGAAGYRLPGRGTGERRWGDHPRRASHETCRPQAVHSTRLGHSGRVFPAARPRHRVTHHTRRSGRRLIGDGPVGGYGKMCSPHATQARTSSRSARAGAS